MFPPKQSFQQRSAGLQQQQEQLAPVNPDMPMGDPLDTIAQMLGLDLTHATNPQQQGQAVVEAVEQLVLHLHQLEGTPPDEGDPNAVDENGDPVQQGEVDENGEPIEQEEQVDAEGNPVEGADDEEVDQESQEEEPEEELPPARLKKKVPSQLSYDNNNTPTFSKRALQLATDGRSLRIQQLAQEGFITPAVAKNLKLSYCSTEAVSLALSMDDDDSDDFDSVCMLLQSNGRVVEFGEKSKTQSGLSRLGANGLLCDMTDKEVLSEETNPLLADAAKRHRK